MGSIGASSFAWAGYVSTAVRRRLGGCRAIEKVVLPLYYEDRARWIWMMKQSISKIGSYFNSTRMMRRYAAEAYLH